MLDFYLDEDYESVKYVLRGNIIYPFAFMLDEQIEEIVNLYSNTPERMLDFEIKEIFIPRQYIGIEEFADDYYEEGEDEDGNIVEFLNGSYIRFVPFDEENDEDKEND